jgi:thioredoxin:protein disulfide reductase
VAALANVKPADQPFRLSVLLDEKDRLELRWSVAPGYFLYRDKVSATLDGKTLKVSTARGEINDDPTLGPTEIIIAKPKRTSMASIYRSRAKY